MKKCKYLILCLVVVILVAGVRIATINASLILDALNITSSGELSLNSAPTSNINIGNNLTTGNVLFSPTNGKVGIGTINPTSKLEIVSNDSNSFKISNRSLNYGINFLLTDENLTTGYSSDIGSFGFNGLSVPWIKYGSGDADWGLVVHENSSGNVGIGDTGSFANERLSVDGNDYVYGVGLRNLKYFKTSAFGDNGLRAEFSLFPQGEPTKLFELYANQDDHLEGSPFVDGLTTLLRLGYYQFGGNNSSIDVSGDDIKYISLSHFFDGNVGIGTTNNLTSKLQVVGLSEYANNAAALTAGLTNGAFYRTGDIVKVVH